jgi:hypothetical protein
MSISLYLKSLIYKIKCSALVSLKKPIDAPIIRGFQTLAVGSNENTAMSDGEQNPKHMHV